MQSNSGLEHPVSASYEELCTRLRDAGTISTIGSLLSWDQETMMPAAAAGFRAEQLSTMARIHHQRFTDPRVGELIVDCLADADLMADPIVGANLREIDRDYRRASRLPESLVAEMSETSSRALQEWKHARESSDFGIFLPWLERQLELNQRKAECHGVLDGCDLYDALVEDFEPGMTGAGLKRLFGPLREASVALYREVQESEPRARADLNQVELSISDQKRFNLYVVERVGFDLKAGRLDTSTHPFSTGLGPGDTRITTRYRTGGFADALSSTLHEAGHALYEQGICRESFVGQPRAESVSLGIHESQSRLWENHVGRSLAFWEWAAPLAQRFFAPTMDSFTPRDFFRSLNSVRPNLIRVESDELTYNLHIMLRFDLERAMILGDLAPRDLPAAWNDRIREDLALHVPDDRRGCLQDIHWSMGSFGYFPTYTLGNLYAAQFWAAMAADHPNVDARMADGEFAPVLDWLRQKIHRHGRRYSAEQLCSRISDRPLDHTALIDHLRRKLRDVYRLDPTPA